MKNLWHSTNWKCLLSIKEGLKGTWTSSIKSSTLKTLPQLEGSQNQIASHPVFWMGIVEFQLDQDQIQGWRNRKREIAILFNSLRKYGNKTNSTEIKPFQKSWERRWSDPEEQMSDFLQPVSIRQYLRISFQNSKCVTKPYKWLTNKKMTILTTNSQ